MILRRIIAAAFAALVCLAPLPAFAVQATLVTPGAPLPMTGLATFLNNALDSVAGCNSGNSAPANGPGAAALTYECWANTSSNPTVFSYYDGASWVEFGTLNTSTHAWAPVGNGQALLTGGAKITSPVIAGDGCTTDRSVSSQIYICQTPTITTNSNVHNFSVSATITWNTGVPGTQGSNEYDAETIVQGNANAGHHTGYQFFSTYQGSATLSALYGFYSDPGAVGTISGSVGQLVHFSVIDATVGMCSGISCVDTQIGYDCISLAAAHTTNICFLSGASTTNEFRGTTNFGTAGGNGIWSSTGVQGLPSLSVGTSSAPSTGQIYENNAAFLIRTKTSFTNGAGSGAGTLTNAPSAGNPTKWIAVDDNGTTRQIPAW